MKIEQMRAQLDFIIYLTRYRIENCLRSANTQAFYWTAFYKHLSFSKLAHLARYHFQFLLVYAKKMFTNIFFCISCSNWPQEFLISKLFFPIRHNKKNITVNCMLRPGVVHMGDSSEYFSDWFNLAMPYSFH